MHNTFCESNFKAKLFKKDMSDKTDVLSCLGLFVLVKRLNNLSLIWKLTGLFFPNWNRSYI